MGAFPNVGGVETISAVLANRFIQDGHRVTICSFEQREVGPDLSSKCETLWLQKPVVKNGNIGKIHDYIVKNKVDILINQWVVPFLTTYVWSQSVKGTNCKVISVHHNKPDVNSRIQALDINIQKGKWLLKPMRWMVCEISRMSLHYCISKSNKYVVLSPSYIEVAKKYARVSKEKLVALGNPITIETSLSPISSSSKKKIIVCVGRIEYNQKCTFRVVDVWKEIEGIYKDWELLFVGDGPDRCDLEERIAKAGLKNIHITGFTNPLVYYKNASILIQTSEYEGFPLVIAECMSYGVVPIVYGSYQAVHDIIFHGKSGFIIPMPFKKEQMVESLKVLMDNPDKLSQMSAVVQKECKSFLLDNIVRRWYKLFEHLQ